MKKWVVLGICVLFMIVGFGCSSDSSSDRSSSDESESTTPMYLTEVDGDDVVDATVDSGFCDHSKQKAVVLFMASPSTNKSIGTVEAVVNTILGFYNDAIANENVRTNRVTLSSSDQVYINEESVPFVIEGSCGGTLTLTDTRVDNVETMTFVADRFCDKNIIANFGVDVEVELHGSGEFINNYLSESSLITTLTFNPGFILKAFGDVLEDDIDMILNINIVSTITPIIEEHTPDRIIKMQNMVGESNIISINVCEIIDNIENETLVLTGTITNIDNMRSLISTTTASLTFTNADGSCIVSTPTPIIEHEDRGIIEGVVVATGAEDTKLKIEVIADNTYEVSVDTNGDGTYDYAAGCIICDLGIVSGIAP